MRNRVETVVGSVLLLLLGGVFALVDAVTAQLLPGAARSRRRRS